MNTTIACNHPSDAAGVRPNLSRLTDRCTPQIEYVRCVTNDMVYFDERPPVLRDELAREFTADFYRRHRRACITVARFAGRPVAHGLFLASLPF